MPGLLPDVDPDGLLEFSVVFTDRALNHMSQRFQGAMRNISAGMRRVYNADAIAIVPGSGTFGMEAVARQLAAGKHVLVIRNGWFSFRWTQIFEMGGIPASHTVLKARPISADPQAPWIPAPLDEVIQTIAREKPALVFAPHVETASGILLPDDYLRALADAVHAYGGMLVLDCIASGAMWVDMKATGVDVLISAPQKGWSSTPCCALIMLNERAKQAVQSSQSTSFAIDLKQWLSIMESYEQGGHAYYTTLPTDALMRLSETLAETEAYGIERVRQEQIHLGQAVRKLLASHGFPSVAAPGFEAPGVVVSYTSDPALQSGKAFLSIGLQTAAGVPLRCDESADYRSFRIGLFGLEKWHQHTRTLAQLEQALSAIQ